MFILQCLFRFANCTNVYSIIQTLHIERTVYTTEYKFPGILRWFEVKDTDVVRMNGSCMCRHVTTHPLSLSPFLQSVMNPVQNGAELIQDNITQLKTIIHRVRGERQNTNPLTMKLNGTLDAAVNGGVSNFDVSEVADLVKLLLSDRNKICCLFAQMFVVLEY